MIPLLVAGGALVAGGLLFSKSNKTWTEVKYVRDIPESEVPADIREKFKGADDSLKGRRIPTYEVPADVREQARKDKNNHHMK